MQWFPACYANLATVNQTVTNITITKLVRCISDTHANCASDATPSDAAPLAD